MIFLVEYDRRAARRISLRTFADNERAEAQDCRLALELELHRRGVDHEVVLLQAESEAALRLTHSRYFETLEEMITKFQRRFQELVVKERGE